MKKLNKTKNEIAELYQSYQAYYLACGFKASPVYSFSKIRWYWVSSSSAKINWLLFVAFWAIIYCIPSY